jgi:hypothetical protein
VYLVVDALDECSNETFRILLRKIREMQGLCSRISFMVTSRCIDALKQAFAGDACLEVRADLEDVEILSGESDGGAL